MYVCFLKIFSYYIYIYIFIFYFFLIYFFLLDNLSKRYIINIATQKQKRWPRFPKMRYNRVVKSFSVEDEEAVCMFSLLYFLLYFCLLK